MQTRAGQSMSVSVKTQGSGETTTIPQMLIPAIQKDIVIPQKRIFNIQQARRSENIQIGHTR